MLLVSVCGCQKENRLDCFKSTGHTETHTRRLPAFNTIRVFDNIEVILVKDSVHFVELVAGENLMGNLNTEVSNGMLTLTNTNKCNWVRSFKRDIKAFVHAPSFRHIIHDGIKTVRTLGVLEQDTIRLDATDAGDFNCQLQSNKVYCTMYEYGNITLKGSASLFVFENYGIGTIFANKMHSETVWANVFGQGDNHVYPLMNLSVTFENKGNVYYYNTPDSPPELTGAGPGKIIYVP